MSSTYSPDLRIELIGTGDQAGVWGNTTNTNLSTVLETAIAGYTSVSIIASSQALTANYGSADEARYAAIALARTVGTGDFAVYAPPASKLYVIYNTSAYVATIYNSSVIGNTTPLGTGVAIPAGKTMTVWSDGTNFTQQNTHLNSPSFTTPALGTPASGTLSSCTTSTQAAKTADTTLSSTAFSDRFRSFFTGSTSGTAALTDRGCLLITTSSITVPAATFAANDAFTIINNSASSISVTQGSGLAMYWAGVSTGSRTLAARGVATVIFVDASTCYILGGGLT